VLHLLAGAEGVDATAALRCAQAVGAEQAGERAVGHFDGVALLEEFLDAHRVALAVAVERLQVFADRRVYPAPRGVRA